MKKLIILLLVLTSCNQTPKNSKILQNSIENCYNIFPISYAKKNTNLEGIKESLQELKKMNINCIWLNPIQESPTYHKYDVMDYYKIDEEFGTLEDYQNLIKEAHKNDIYVVMDFVQNHASSKHPWFLEAIENKNSKYHDYFIFNDLKDTNKYPNHEGWYEINDEYYYSSFDSGMPDFNYENKEVRKYMKDIAEYWIKQGVDGFRIDAAKYIYAQNEYPNGTDIVQKNIEWFKEFNTFVKKENKDIFIISEIWDQNSYIAPYLQGMDAVFDFTYQEMTTKMILTHDSKKWVEMQKTTEELFSKENKDYVRGIFLSNHDQNRIMSTLGNNMQRMKLASSILFTSPGKPFIYYGEELGMLGRKPDEAIREPYVWGNDLQTTWEENLLNQNTTPFITQDNDENSLLNHYRTVSKLRKDPVFNLGKFKEIPNENANLLMYEMNYKDKKYVIIHNLHTKTNLEIEGKFIYGKLENGVLQQYESIVVEVQKNYKIKE